MPVKLRFRNGTLIALVLLTLPVGIVFWIETSDTDRAGIDAPEPTAAPPPPAMDDMPPPLPSGTGANSPANVEAVRPARPQPAIVRSPDPGRSPLADPLNAPAGDIRTDLAILQRVFDNFRLELGANPVGNNREITAQLTGRNPHRHAPLPKNHPAISETGELLDRWGTPFFFHALSARVMEIRSAGPDRATYTADDVLSSPGPVRVD